jgi:di/tripeptidase
MLHHLAQFLKAAPAKFAGICYPNILRFREQYRSFQIEKGTHIADKQAESLEGSVQLEVGKPGMECGILSQRYGV